MPVPRAALISIGSITAVTWQVHRAMVAPDASRILLHNLYGWLERAERGGHGRQPVHTAFTIDIVAPTRFDPTAWTLR